MSSVDYDVYADDYAALRLPDPHIAAAIEAALGEARTIVNVGAGTGSYESSDRDVTAVEPFAEMIANRPVGAAPAIQGNAESLPFPDGAFDAAMAILTVHHWTDQERGLSELCRVARRRVVVTFDPDFADMFWLVRDYLPENAELDRLRFRPLRDVVEMLGGGEARVVPVPHDCTDGFLCAYWRRPQAYLDPRVRAGISTFARLDTTVVARALGALERDLDSGAFWDRHADLVERDAVDLGYRLIVAGTGARCDATPPAVARECLGAWRLV